MHGVRDATPGSHVPVMAALSYKPSHCYKLPAGNICRPGELRRRPAGPGRPPTAGTAGQAGSVRLRAGRDYV